MVVILILFFILLVNAVFSYYDALLEAFSDNKNYMVSKIFGRDKHFYYSTVRWCLWIVCCMWFSTLFSGRLMIIAPVLLIIVILLQFRFIHDCLLPCFRNDLNPDACKERIYYKGNGTSTTDKILGAGFKSRLICFIISFPILALLIYLILNNK